jgi:DNA invertase Pin-like site-specific DNA recombinase
MTRVAIYARVSTSEQNPDSQLLILREYAARRGFEIYQEYVDYVSGVSEKRYSKSRSKDKAYQELMTAVRRRQVDCVLVWKYDRLARSLNLLVTALQEFSSLGVDFISYTQNIDTTTPMGKLFYHIIASFAEFERGLIVERVKAGLDRARSEGKKLGRPEKNPAASARIVKMRDQGMSLRSIAQTERLSPAGVLKILRRATNNR